MSGHSAAGRGGGFPIKDRAGRKVLICNETYLGE